MRRIIDVHTHCFQGVASAGAFLDGLEKLRREGLRQMAVAGLVNTALPAKTMWRLIPEYVENYGDDSLHEADDLLELTGLSGETLFPLVDTRALCGDVAAELNRYIEQGFRGLKGIYLADDRNDLGVASVPEALGISPAAYERREWEIFAFAETNDLPLLYHMDARLYGDRMKALLDDFPRVRVDFAHFGIGRKAFRPFLDRYPNVYTDLASMLPHVKADPAGYREFIMHYPDRVCFGSDAFLYAPETVLDYIRMVHELDLPADVEERVFHTNPARFLGIVTD